MTTEERLAEIRKRVESLDPEWGAVADREWLLELVDELQEEMNCVLDYNLVNQELTLENQRLLELVDEQHQELDKCADYIERQTERLKERRYP